MYAATLESPNPARLCVEPLQQPVKQPATVEAELIQRLKAGDERTFREIVERFGPKIYRVAYAILRNHEDADDIAQEVFAKVYFSIKTFEARSSLYTWISRIAVNECYGYLRKRRSRPACESDFPDGTFSMRMQMMPDQEPTADHALTQRDFVNKLLARIPEDERTLLIWKEVEGFSVSELSQMTGLRENTIKVRLFRARHRLVRAAAQLSGRKLCVGSFASILR
jgi:RNA polymerase sigma-70 factor (ECF subfamily)